MSSRMGRMLLAHPKEAAWIQKALITASEQEGEPDAPQASASPGALAHALRSLLGGVFSGADGAAAPRRGLGEHTVNRLFAAAEEYLRTNVARPIYNADICEALRISPRTLHDAFVTACGMSPQAYLKLRRLMLVRCALRSGGPGGARLVKSVALAHGFWHLGNFAHDYRVYFGETPSETLAAARSTWGSPSRNAEEEAGLGASPSTHSGQPRAGAGAAQCGRGASPQAERQQDPGGGGGHGADRRKRRATPSPQHDIAQIHVADPHRNRIGAERRDPDRSPEGFARGRSDLGERSAANTPARHHS